MGVGEQLVCDRGARNCCAGAGGTIWAPAMVQFAGSVSKRELHRPTFIQTQAALSEGASHAPLVRSNAIVALVVPATLVGSVTSSCAPHTRPLAPAEPSVARVRSWRASGLLTTFLVYLSPETREASPVRPKRHSLLLYVGTHCAERRALRFALVPPRVGSRTLLPAGGASAQEWRRRARSGAVAERGSPGVGDDGACARGEQAACCGSVAEVGGRAVCVEQVDAQGVELPVVLRRRAGEGAGGPERDRVRRPRQARPIHEPGCNAAMGPWPRALSVALARRAPYARHNDVAACCRHARAGMDGGW